MQQTVERPDLEEDDEETQQMILDEEYRKRATLQSDDINTRD